MADSLELRNRQLLVAANRNHKHLFQDIYPWAGKKRTEEISKEGKPFFPISHFQNAFLFIDTLILEYKKINKNDKEKVAQILAQILDNVNYLHPFREGNGRTQREFMRLLALEKGFILNLNPPDDKHIYERYMKGTISGDTSILYSLIFELLDNSK